MQPSLASVAAQPGASSDTANSFEPANPPNELHPQWHVRCIMLLVAFLHTRHHVSFKACGLILLCLNFILSALPGSLIGPQPMPTTLPTVFSRLGLKGDRFIEYIICPTCHRLFNRDLDVDTGGLCPDCQTELFHPATRQLFQSVASVVTGAPPAPPRRKPKLVSPIQVLSDGLRDFFQRPGMVAAVDQWKTRPTVPGESRCIQDGKIWQTIKGPDGQKFFYGTSSEDEIRLGVTFSLDWCFSSCFIVLPNSIPF